MDHYDHLSMLSTNWHGIEDFYWFSLNNLIKITKRNLKRNSELLSYVVYTGAGYILKAMNEVSYAFDKDLKICKHFLVQDIHCSWPFMV